MSAIDRYLDDLFDRLAGTGGAGRRALAEAEDHLRTAAADAMAGGLAAGEAEREAVCRFGPAAMVARRLRAADGARRAARAFSGGWLLAGLTASGFGIAYMTAAGRIGWSAPQCTVILSASCYLLGPLYAVRSAAVAAAAGAALLLGRRLAIRYGGVAPARRQFAQAAGITITLAAVATGAVGWIPVPRFALMPSHATDLVIATAALECLGAAAIVIGSRPRRKVR